MLITDKFARSGRSLELLDEPEEHGKQLRRLQDLNYYFLERTALNSRVLIIEGISGSGKDLFQRHLKKKLEARNLNLYDYSEGEVLHSWKQLQINGIFELRIKFMKLFANYMSDIVRSDKKAVFLLNRFHLSTYVFTIIQQPKLEPEYEEIINVLRTLPVYIFMLQLDKNEIEKRSWHPERSGAWRKFQEQIVEREGFRGRLERYSLQQRLMLELAQRQQIPYSVIKLSLEHEAGKGQDRVTKAAKSIRPLVLVNATDERISKRKRHLPPTF